jgi:hypothetical protein
MKKCECETPTGDDRCADMSNNGYFCTRRINHDGDHIACGIRHGLETWPNQQAAELTAKAAELRKAGKTEE